MLPYKLDYTIERDTDRLDVVNNIVNTISTQLRHKDLELMANYLLYGKDENGKNSMQRKEVLDTGKRHTTYNKKSDKEESLDAFLEKEDNNFEFQELGAKRIYKVPRQRIEPEDRQLGNGLMAELQDCIARLEHSVAVAEGRATPSPDDSYIESSYKLYLTKHILIDMRRHQYYIKDAYKSAIKFNHSDKPMPQKINWSAPVHVGGDQFVEFDWENYKHVAALIKNYSGIRMDNWEDPLSWGTIMIIDFDRYVDMADLTPVELQILISRIDGLTAQQINEELIKKFGRGYTNNYISLFASEKIPRKISLAAKRYRLKCDKNVTRAVCPKCGQEYPDDPCFFKTMPDRSVICKDCDKKRRKDRQWLRKERV